MRGQIAWMLMGVLPLVQAAVIDRRGSRRVARQDEGLDGILGNLAPDNNDANGPTTVTETMMQTVTVNNAASGFGNQSTVTVTEFADGAAPLTVTVTEPASTVTVGNAAVNPDASPVIISGATSNHGIVIVSLTDTRGPTTTRQISTTAVEEPAVTSLVDTSLAAAPPAETSLVESSLEEAPPAETSLEEAVPPPEATATALPLLTESLSPLPTAITSVEIPTSALTELLTQSLAPFVPSDTVTEVPAAAETSLQSSIELGLGDTPTAPAAEQPAAPEVTEAPDEVLNPAVGEALTLDTGIALASTLALGNLGG